MPNSLQQNRKKFSSLQASRSGASSLQPQSRGFSSLNQGSNIRDFIKNLPPAPQSRVPIGPIQQQISKPSVNVPSGNAAATSPARQQFVQQATQTPQQAPQTFTTPSGASGTVEQLQALGGSQAPQQAAPPTLSVSPTPSAQPTQQQPISKSQELKDFIATLAKSQQERELEERLNATLSGGEQSINQIRNQPIAQNFITGQAAAVERQTQQQATGLQRELERLSGQRGEQSEQQRFLLDLMQQERTGEESSRRFDIGQQNVQTEQQLEQSKFDESKRQFGIKEQSVDTQIVQAGGRSVLINSQTGEEIRDLGATEGALARFATLSKAAEDAKSAGEDVSPFLKELGSVATTNVSDLKGRVAINTVGAGALFGIKVPGTDAFDFAADLETLKADIGFGILQQMREASKTGGALGQVSERELAFLQATLGSLNQLQSAGNFNKNLDRVQKSINRWTSSVESSGGSFTTAGGNQVTITETQ